MADQISVKTIKLGYETARIRLSDGSELLIPLDLVRQRNLAAGVALTEAQLPQLQAESERCRCQQQAARLLALRDHSERELHTKLKRRGYKSDTISDIIGRYRRLGTLDDSRYASEVARTLVARRPCGKAYLCAYLQRRGIARSLAEAVSVTALSDTEDTDRALAALEQRCSHWDQFALETAQRKAYNYLARRGFSHAAASNAWNRFRQAQDED